MSAYKYPSIFSRQMQVIVYVFVPLVRGLARIKCCKIDAFWQVL